AKPDNVAKTSRVSERPSEIAAVGEWQHSTGERNGRPAATAAAGFAQIVGITRRAEHFVEGLRTGAEFRRIGFAYYDCARPFETLYKKRVLDRDEILIDTGAERRANALGQGEVFHRVWQAVQWADMLSPGQFLVGLLRKVERGFSSDQRANCVHS